MVNKQFYLKVLRHLREDVRRKCSKDWLLYHDSSLCAAVFDQNQQVNGPSPLPTLLILLAPHYFIKIQGGNFENTEEFEVESQEVLNNISKTFPKGSSRMLPAVRKALETQGDCFEGDQ